MTRNICGLFLFRASRCLSVAVCWPLSRYSVLSVSITHSPLRVGRLCYFSDNARGTYWRYSWSVAGGMESGGRTYGRTKERISEWTIYQIDRQQACIPNELTCGWPHTYTHACICVLCSWCEWRRHIFICIFVARVGHEVDDDRYKSVLQAKHIHRNGSAGQTVDVASAAAMTLPLASSLLGLFEIFTTSRTSLIACCAPDKMSIIEQNAGKTTVPARVFWKRSQIWMETAGDEETDVLISRLLTNQKGR